MDVAIFQALETLTQDGHHLLDIRRATYLPHLLCQVATCLHGLELGQPSEPYFNKSAMSCSNPTCSGRVRFLCHDPAIPWATCEGGERIVDETSRP
jgi:hypothetical protein